MKKPNPQSPLAIQLGLDLRSDNLKYHYVQRGPQQITKHVAKTPEGKCAIAINMMLDASPITELPTFYDAIGITEDYHDELVSGNIKWKDSKLAQHMIIHWDINPLFIYSNSAVVWCGNSPKLVQARSSTI